MKRNIDYRLGILLLLCVLAAQLCLPALADDADTVYINDAGDLTAFAAQCAYDAWSQGKTVVLQRDISLGGVAFEPIASFGGTFEGNGHTVSGLSVTDSVSPAGLFGTVAAGGIVRDLTVEGSVAPGGSAEVVGGVVGCNYGRIESCTFTGTVDGEKSVGGIAGVNMASGVLRRCQTGGGVFGKNMTGGVTGENHGAVYSCVNRAYVNTNTLDPSFSFDKLELSFDSLTSPDTYNVTVDSGGVAGYSDGGLTGCRNYGSVGYQHIGYNVGGIVGRSSGHVATSTNDARIYGRREVGGVVGMAEPYIRLDLRESSVEEVRRQLDALSSTIDRTVDDAEAGADTISARLTLINSGVDEAGTHAQTVTDRLSDTYDGTVSEINRGSEILSSTIEQLDDVVKDLIAVSDTMTDALASLERTMNDLNDGPGGNVFDQIRYASNDVRSASDTLKTGVADMQKGLDTLRGALDAITPENPVPDSDIISKGMGELSAALDTIRPAFDELRSAMDHLGNAMTSAEAASRDLQTTTQQLQDASGEMSTALRDADSLLRYLKKQEKLQFPTLGDETDAEADALYDSLRGVSNNIELLNQEAKTASDVVLEDVRQINRQFTALMNTLLDVVEDAEGMSPTSVVEDTSDEDIDAAVSGKVLLCANTGVVSGDIDVGGVAGAMMVYNELDPESDDDTLSSAFHRRYELKCILQDCVNSGAVTGKRDNVGAVCGSGTLGVISGCEGYGSASSEGGSYVGGVVGNGDNILRRCWAKCALSGGKYVGGIVGSDEKESASLRVEGCRSLVDITDSVQYAGAVAGFERGTFSDNRFVSDTLAGIDRVSYRGEAEPVSYEELLAGDGVPQEFRRFTLNFVADGATIRSLRFDYGDSFDASAFPEIPAVEGKFARWDRDDLSDLRFDTTVTAVYESELTALGSAVTRSAARPVFLVEGAFDDAMEFDASPAILDFDAGQEGPWHILRSWRRAIQEQWQLTLPDDGARSHVVRYLPPEGVSDRLELYERSDDGSWTLLDSGTMGSYLTFETAKRDLSLTVVSAATPWWVWALVNVFLLGAAALLAELLIRKKPKQIPQTDEEKARAAARKKKRSRLRIILIAAVLALGVAVAVVVRLAPRISDSMGLYRLVRGYAERSDLDMELTISGKLHGEEFETGLPLYATTCEGKRVSCVLWEDIPFWSCDGALVLENGKAYQAGGILADYSELLTHAAGLYRAVDVAVSEENGVKTYRVSAAGEDARRVFATLLPGMTDVLPESESVELALIVTDGELTSLLVDWDSGENSAHAELKMQSSETAHTLPQAVRSTIVSGGCADAPALGDALGRLLLAWTEAASRDTLTADVTLKANCGPLLVDEKLTWQRTRAYAQELSCLSRRGGAIYYTDDAACTGGGLAVSRASAAYTDTASLLRLAYQAFLLGEAECVETADGWRYTVTLDAEAMESLAALIAPDIRSMELSAEQGSVRLELRDDTFSSLYIQCKGSVRVVRADVPAALSARLDFDPDAVFAAPSAAVLSALGLSE